MNGLYIGSSGMINYMQHLNVAANNIANTQTVGFKSDQLTSKVFQTEDTYRNDAMGRTVIGEMDYAVIPRATHVNLMPGTMRITNSSTDFYLENANADEASFFVVQQGDGTFLTRNGQFSMNNSGYLQTPSGALVLDVNNNSIQIAQGTSIGVRGNGQLYDTNTNETIATLQTKMVNKEAAAALEKHENSTFTVQGTDIAALPNGTAQIHNYMLENSNVDITKEMSDMMMNQSLLKASQRVMLSFEKIYEKEANELGK